MRRNWWRLLFSSATSQHGNDQKHNLLSPKTTALITLVPLSPLTHQGPGRTATSAPPTATPMGMRINSSLATIRGIGTGGGKEAAQPPPPRADGAPVGCLRITLQCAPRGILYVLSAACWECDLHCARSICWTALSRHGSAPL